MKCPNNCGGNRFTFSTPLSSTQCPQWLRARPTPPPGRGPTGPRRRKVAKSKVCRWLQCCPRTAPRGRGGREAGGGWGVPPPCGSGVCALGAPSPPPLVLRGGQSANPSAGIVSMFGDSVVFDCAQRPRRPLVGTSIRAPVSGSRSETGHDPVGSLPCGPRAGKGGGRSHRGGQASFSDPRGGGSVWTHSKGVGGKTPPPGDGSGRTLRPSHPHRPEKEACMGFVHVV